MQQVIEENKITVAAAPERRSAEEFLLLNEVNREKVLLLVKELRRNQSHPIG